MGFGSLAHGDRIILPISASSQSKAAETNRCQAKTERMLADGAFTPSWPALGGIVDNARHSKPRDATENVLVTFLYALCECSDSHPVDGPIAFASHRFGRKEKRSG